MKKMRSFIVVASTSIVLSVVTPLEEDAASSTTDAITLFTTEDARFTIEDARSTTEDAHFHTEGVRSTTEDAYFPTEDADLENSS